MSNGNATNVLTFLFNLFLNDLILFLYTAVLSNYADDNKLYALGNDNEETKKHLSKTLRQ